MNPSYANTDLDDITVLKLIRFSKKFDFGGFYLGNLQTYITPYPSILKDKIIKIETANVMHLKKMIDVCEMIVFGWENAGDIPKWLKEIVENPLCFGHNQNGAPKHPLYLSYKTTLIPFEPNKY